MRTFAPLGLVLLLVVSTARASERVEPPRLRATPPARVEAPRSPAPARVRVAEPARAKSSSSARTAKVNVNTADVAALMTLAGVGRTVAERIVAHRDAHGPFRKAEEVRRVEGVSRAVWERNRGRIVVK